MLTEPLLEVDPPLGFELLAEPLLVDPLFGFEVLAVVPPFDAELFEELLFELELVEEPLL